MQRKEPLSADAKRDADRFDECKRLGRLNENIGKSDEEVWDMAGMKRFLIFAVLFPPLALVIFKAPDVIMHHDFKLLDSVALIAAYTLMIIPALILAWVDQAFHRLGTVIAGTAIAYLGVLIVGFPFSDPFAALMIGLIGAVPAAVCSWLSDKSMRSVDA